MTGGRPYCGLGGELARVGNVVTGELDRAVIECGEEVLCEDYFSHDS